MLYSCEDIPLILRRDLVQVHQAITMVDAYYFFLRPALGVQ